MNVCQKILTSCIGADCDNPIFSGIESVAWIFNKSEIASLTYDNTNKNTVTAITMKTYDNEGTDVAYVGYLVTQLGKEPFTGTTTSMTEGNVQNNFTETVVFSLPDNCPSAGAILDMIANGSFTVVLANEYTGSDTKGKYQIYGGKKALKCTAIEREAYGDNQGGWQITLTAENCPNSSLFVYHTTTEGGETVEDTESYLNSLVDCGD